MELRDFNIPVTLVARFYPANGERCSYCGELCFGKIFRCNLAIGRTNRLEALDGTVLCSGCADGLLPEFKERIRL